MVANCDSGREYCSGQWSTVVNSGGNSRQWWPIVTVVESTVCGQWWTVETTVDSGGQL